MGKKKVLIEFEDDEGRTEMIEAEPLKGQSLYRLVQSPAFAYGVSINDVVRAESGEDERLRFESAIEKSGNRTLRVIFGKHGASSKEVKPFLKAIKKLGASYEIKQSHLLCIITPPEIELQSVVGFLLEQGLWWEYADPTWDTLFPD
ncbi:MAG TPA: DUF4265 domain-containing protein [Pyrinomonadaceae bacterium]|nr:DUF4265 domain-containing protein [Pyrinomonadaceae bacterium]